MFGENSLVFQEARSHQQQRQLLLPAFHGDNLKFYGQYELKLVTAIILILFHFELSLTDKRPVHPVRRGITIVPSGGVKMVVTKKAKLKRQTILST